VRGRRVNLRRLIEARSGLTESFGVAPSPHLYGQKKAPASGSRDAPDPCCGPVLGTAWVTHECHFGHSRAAIVHVP
jgi:hypothetical protein